MITRYLEFSAEADGDPHLHRALEHGSRPRELLDDFDELRDVVVPQKHLMGGSHGLKWAKLRERERERERER